MPRRKNSIRRSNPVELEKILGDMNIPQIGIATAAVSGFKALQLMMKSKFNIDISQYGKLIEGLIKLGLGLGAVLLVEKSGLVEENSDVTKALKLAAIFMGIQDISESFVENGYNFATGAESALNLQNNIGYASDPFGNKITYDHYQNELRNQALQGGFYSGNAAIPRGSAMQPDFLNQVVGRSDLSAIPDHMR